MSVLQRPIGAPVDRIEGHEKVTGEALYAFEYEHDHVAYAAIVQSTVAKGAVATVDAAAARRAPGRAGGAFARERADACRAQTASSRSCNRPGSPTAARSSRR